MVSVKFNYQMNVWDVCVMCLRCQKKLRTYKKNFYRNKKNLWKIYHLSKAREREIQKKKVGSYEKKSGTQFDRFSHSLTPSLSLSPFSLTAHHSFSPHSADLQWNDNNIYHMEQILSFDFFNYIYGFTNGWWNSLSVSFLWKI